MSEHQCSAQQQHLPCLWWREAVVKFPWSDWCRALSHSGLGQSERRFWGINSQRRENQFRPLVTTASRESLCGLRAAFCWILRSSAHPLDYCSLFGRVLLSAVDSYRLFVIYLLSTCVFCHLYSERAVWKRSHASAKHSLSQEEGKTTYYLIILYYIIDCVLVKWDVNLSCITCKVWYLWIVLCRS